MDFDDSPDEAEFRAELRQWLVDHADDARIPDDPAERADAQNAWHSVLYDAGYIALSFPVEYGGHGHSAGLRGDPQRRARPRRRATDRRRRPHVERHPALRHRRAAARPVCPGCSPARCAGARASASPTPGRDLAGLTHARRREVGSRRRLLPRQRPQDLDELRGRGRLVLPAVSHRARRTQAPRASRCCWCRCRHPGVEPPSDPERRPQPRVRRGDVRRRRRARRDTCWASAVRGGRSRTSSSPTNAVRATSTGSPGSRSTCARSRLRCVTARIPDTPATRARLGEAYAELRALQVKVQRSLSERVHGALPGAEGSIDKLLMTRGGPDDRPRGHGPARQPSDVRRGTRVGRVRVVTRPVDLRGDPADPAQHRRPAGARAPALLKAVSAVRQPRRARTRAWRHRRRPCPLPGSA